MRQITHHAINPANEVIEVIATDERGHGGANHSYELAWNGSNHYYDSRLPGHHRVQFVCPLLFQNGPVNQDGNGVNGITHEALLAVLIDRLEGFQAGPYANPHNALALDHLYAALAQLHNRTQARMARGVEGTHTV